MYSEVTNECYITVCYLAKKKTDPQIASWVMWADILVVFGGLVFALISLLLLVMLAVLCPTYSDN